MHTFNQFSNLHTKYHEINKTQKSGRALIMHKICYVITIFFSFCRKLLFSHLESLEHGKREPIHCGLTKKIEQ